MTSKHDASRSSTSRISSNVPPRPGPLAGPRTSSAWAASFPASCVSPPRSATTAASDRRWAAVGSPRNSGTRPSLNNCRLAVSPRSSWRNSATTKAAVGSRSAQASRTTSARSMLPAKTSSSARRTRAPISVGVLRTAALAAVSASARLPSRNKRPASPGLGDEGDIYAPLYAAGRRELGHDVTGGANVVELVVRPQVNGAAERAGLSRPLADLHIALDQGETRPRFARAVDVGIDVVLEPSIELSLDLVGGAEGSHHVPAHHLEEVGETGGAKHRVELRGKPGIRLGSGGRGARIAGRRLHAARR